MATTYDLDEFQKKLPEIVAGLNREGGHYILTQKKKPSLVAISYREYAEISEIAQELQAHDLKRDVSQARREYRDGKTRDFREFTDDNP